MKFSEYIYSQKHRVLDKNFRIKGYLDALENDQIEEYHKKHGRDFF